VSALSEIRAGITEMRNHGVLTTGRVPKLRVVVGYSAELSIVASIAVRSRQVPTLPSVIDDCPVSRTNEFKGWAIEPA
jgi:hypothetical protein